MKFFRPMLLALATLGSLASCTQRLPDVAELDRCQRRAEELARPEIVALERRRPSMSESAYQKAKAELDDRITRKGIEMAWTSHSLAEIERENLGIPSPDHPQAINVPEAGALPTGSDFRRFNQTTDPALGTTGETVSGMREMMGRTNVGTNIRGHQGSLN